jgi:gas vesicle protein
MTSSGSPEGVREHVQSARGTPYMNVHNGRSVSLLGIGMVVGAVIGAGVALMVAPRSGTETRRQIGRGIGRLRGKRGVWGQLGRELRRAASAKRKTMEIEAKRREIALRRAEAGKA